MYLAGQLGHLSGQSDVWAVGQRTSTACLLTGLVTVADLIEKIPNKNQCTKRQWATKDETTKNCSLLLFSQTVLMVQQFFIHFLWKNVASLVVESYRCFWGPCQCDIFLSLPFFSLKGLITCSEQLSSGTYLFVGLHIFMANSGSENQACTAYFCLYMYRFYSLIYKFDACTCGLPH